MKAEYFKNCIELRGGLGGILSLVKLALGWILDTRYWTTIAASVIRQSLQIEWTSGSFAEITFLMI